jgi:hypothetical protein
MEQFLELYSLDFEQRSALPSWLENLWQDAQLLNDGLSNWLDDDGQVEIMNIIDEFRTSSYAYIRAGIIAHNIRYKRLYRKAANSFSAFCQKWLGQSIWQINRAIAASQVAIKLISFGFIEIPANESQCRPLVNLNDDDLINTWRKVCKFIPEPDRTAKAIQGIIARQQEIDPDFEGKATTRRIEIEADQWSLLNEKAAKYGMSPKRYLELLIQKDLADEPELFPEPDHDDELVDDDEPDNDEPEQLTAIEEGNYGRSKQSTGTDDRRWDRPGDQQGDRPARTRKQRTYIPAWVSRR